MLVCSAGNVYAECISGNCENGQGTMTYADGGTYVGQWKDGKYHGQGTYTVADGEKYVGEWKDGNMHGQGTMTYADGSTYVGQWKDGNRDGHGTLTEADGIKIVGQWRNNLQEIDVPDIFPAHSNSSVTNMFTNKPMSKENKEILKKALEDMSSK